MKIIYPLILTITFVFNYTNPVFPQEKNKKLKDNKFVVVKVFKVLSFANGRNVVFLHETNGKKIIPIWIGGHEAYAIELRLNRQKPSRPVTLDILEEILKLLGGKIIKLEIDDLKSGIFLGRLYIGNNGKTHILDTRPSDSIGLCVGADAPIYVARTVIEKTGIAIDEVMQQLEPKEESTENEKKKPGKKVVPEGDI